MEFRYASEDDAAAMAELFAANHHDALSERQRADQGFVQGLLDIDAMRSLAASRNMLVADENGQIAGLLGLSPPGTMPSPPPPVRVLLDTQELLSWQDKSLSETPWLLYGPVVVDAAYRGQGVARGLFTMAITAAAQQVDAMVTFIETSNLHSLHVHIDGFNMRPLTEFVADGRNYKVLAISTLKS
jgi:predicted GNAT family N-acyltransferase